MYRYHKPVSQFLQLAVAAFALLPALVLASEADLQKKVDELDQQVKILQRKLENAGEDPQKAKKENPSVASIGPGPGLKSAGGDFTIRVGGVLQFDARSFDNGYRGQYAGSSPATVNASKDFLVRRARPTVEGSVYGQYGFRITPDFASTTPTLVDAWISDAIDPGFRVYVGKQIPSLEIERLQTSTDTRFNELSLVSNLVPTRDIGIQVSGDLLSNTLNYTVGIMNGVADGVTSGNSNLAPNKEFLARIIAQPFANRPGFLQGLSFGVAASRQSNRGGTANPSVSTVPTLATNLPSYSSIGQQTIFSYRSDTNETNTTFANGDQTRLIPQLAYFNGSFGLVSEYVRENIAVQRNYGAGTVNQRSADLQIEGAQTTVVWAITGEDESLKAFKPARVLDPASGGWGGWEIAARFSRINFDKDAFEINGQLVNNTHNFADPTRSVRSVDDVGLGVNWYPNGVLRVSLDYDHSTFSWGGGGTAVNPKDRPNEDVLIGRIQMAF